MSSSSSVSTITRDLLRMNPNYCINEKKNGFESLESSLTRAINAPTRMIEVTVDECAM